MLSSAALLVNRKVIDEVGGFDERFHMYGEDNEWALRVVRALSWLLLFEPEATVLRHYGKIPLTGGLTLRSASEYTRAFSGCSVYISHERMHGKSLDRLWAFHNQAGVNVTSSTAGRSSPRPPALQR